VLELGREDEQALEDDHADQVVPIK
jgi:hypothetical protein